MRQKAFLGKLLKKLEAKIAAQQNYGGVQQLPIAPVGYDERIQYSKGGSMNYDKKKMMGGGYNMMEEKKRGGMGHGGRMQYGHGGKASSDVFALEAACNSMAGYNASLKSKP